MESLKTFTVQLLNVSVASYSPNNNMLILDIHFDSGSKQCIRRSARLCEPQLLAKQLINEILLQEQEEHVEFDGESLMEAEIQFENLHKTTQQLTSFFRTIYGKAMEIRNSKSSAGYLDRIRSLQRTSFL